MTKKCPWFQAWRSLKRQAALSFVILSEAKDPRNSAPPSAPKGVSTNALGQIGRQRGICCLALVGALFTFAIRKLKMAPQCRHPPKGAVLPLSSSLWAPS